MKPSTIFYILLLFIFSVFLVAQKSGAQGTSVPPNQITVKLVAAPQQLVTVVPATVTNSFPLPLGTSVCIVTRNIPQSPGVDYSIVGGNVVFSGTVSTGDVVQLNCW